MRFKIFLIFFLALQAISMRAHPGKNEFLLQLVNNSRYTTTCTILGNEKIDSVVAGQTKSILFELDEDQPSFFLSLSSSDLSAGSYRNRLLRILNTKGSKEISITAGNQLNYELSFEEKVIAAVNPQLRAKNFWKLDSVLLKNRNNIAAAEIIFLSICDIDVKTDTIKKYYDLLGPDIRSSAFGKRISNYLDARDRLNLGNKLDNFSLPDTLGQLVRLDKIKSDFILLDFWFSRCGPCIKSFPDLQQLYLRTNRKDFEIMGISVDTKAENELWRSTVKKYNLPWLNLNDPRYAMVKSLAIVNYPTKILLDSERKIVLVDTNNSYGDFYREIERLISIKNNK
jgi:peroxiredoxin